MVMKPEPIFEAVEYVRSYPDGHKQRHTLTGTGKVTKSQTKIILLTPQGKRLDQRLAKRFSKLKHLILICGHYEGVDERVRERL
ncbi:unnamed protein product, partial [marine sediment metagenome]